MKITPKLVLLIVGGIGALIIIYGLVRQFIPIDIDENTEKVAINVLLFGTLGFYLYARKLISDERRAKEAAEKAAAEQVVAGEAGLSVQTEEPEEDENLPHWERAENDEDSEA